MDRQIRQAEITGFRRLDLGVRFMVLFDGNPAGREISFMAETEEGVRRQISPNLIVRRGASMTAERNVRGRPEVLEKILKNTYRCVWT
jgi:hypothetical protein